MLILFFKSYISPHDRLLGNKLILVRGYYDRRVRKPAGAAPDHKQRLRSIKADIGDWLALPDLAQAAAHSLHERLSAIDHALERPQSHAAELKRLAHDLANWLHAADLPPAVAAGMTKQLSAIRTELGLPLH